MKIKKYLYFKLEFVEFGLYFVKDENILYIRCSGRIRKTKNQRIRILIPAVNNNNIGKL